MDLPVRLPHLGTVFKSRIAAKPEPEAGLFMRLFRSVWRLYMQLTPNGSGSLHHRIRAFSKLFLTFSLAFGDPSVALCLALVCTLFVAVM